MTVSCKGRAAQVLARRKNAEYRQPEYLSETGVKAVMGAAVRCGRHGLRDSILIPIAYRHGLQGSERVALRWDQVDLPQGLLHVTRL
jgi:type 1 fimbriae regulatory protein FimE